MNKVKAAALLAALLCGAVLGSSAYAHHGRHGYHGHNRSHVGIWFGFPAPIFYPSYPYYPRYYYPPETVVVPAPTTYIEQSPPAAAAPSPTQSSGAYWYFCPDSQTYYPYVQQCASQWQQVVPRSAPPS